MNLVARRPRAGRSGGSAWVLVAVGCAAALALVGSGLLAGTAGPSAQERPDDAGRPVTTARASAPSFRLMQMNLCLSGMAGCWEKAAYPAVLEEAVSRIRAQRPDAVTLSEGCREDVERIARRTGYHLHFVRIIYNARRLPCTDPGSRGLFGDAVLTEARIAHSDSRPFAAQAGLEERRWLCVTTGLDQDVCTAHLGTRSTTTAARANDAQCAQLGRLLARRAATRAVAFGGDVNRHDSCAPDGAWTRTDRAAAQAAGLQHVYGSRADLTSPRAEVLPAHHSDHDVLLVTARAGPR